MDIRDEIPLLVKEHKLVNTIIKGTAQAEKEVQENNDGKLLFLMGQQYYQKNNRSARDLATAIKWYRMAADLDYAKAQFALGVCYSNGLGVKEDMKKAVFLFRSAAVQGYAPAQFSLSICYANGFGTEVNTKEAEKWLMKAVEYQNRTARNSK